MSTIIFRKKGNNMANQDIRNEIKESGLYKWQIAERIGMNDGNFSRLLRRELSDEKKTLIRSAIKELKEGAK